jgi:hypothetical protein
MYSSADLSLAAGKVRHKNELVICLAIKKNQHDDNCYTILLVVYFMVCVGKLWKLFLANLLAGNSRRETHFSLLILANIKQSQNPVLIRKTKKKEVKQQKIFENLKKKIRLK